MPKRIYQSEFCNVCRHKPVCNSTKCSDFSRLEDCRCDELRVRIDNALKFAKDIGAQEIIDALNGKVEYPQNEDRDEHGQARTNTEGNGDK